MTEQLQSIKIATGNLELGEFHMSSLSYVFIVQ